MGDPKDERELLAAARSGDDEAFRRLVEPHRALLHAHSYRMLGSLHDADDVLQEALIRSWRGIRTFDGRSAFRTWLFRIVTNACLDAIARRPKRVLPIDYGRPDGAVREPPAGAAWLEPYPDGSLGVEDGDASPEARYEQREAVELALVAALQHLPPRQRAVLILKDVLAFSAEEVGDAIGSSATSVYSALQRARAAVRERVPERSQQATARSIGDERVREIVERFGDAFERGDAATIVALLTQDAAFSMPPFPETHRGREAVADSWLIPGGPPGQLRVVTIQANGQPAVAVYALDGTASRYVPIALDVLTLREGLVSEVTAFRMPELFPRFELPAELERLPRPASRDGRSPATARSGSHVS